MQGERTPQRVESIDINQLEINGLESFLYSCIDGVLKLEDLADLSGLDEKTVRQIVDRLVTLGLVRWPEDRAQNDSNGSAAELDEQVVLNAEEQGYIREVHPRLGVLTHYEILGLRQDADKAAIRQAYFALSKRFHPDSYFGKNLGTFKSQMEAIFTRLTDAYEVLGKKKKREAYDRYLSRNAAVSAVERQMERGVEQVAAMTAALTQGPASEAPSVDSVPQESDTDSQRRRSSQPADAAARARRKRELLERRLRPRARPPSREDSARPSREGSARRSSIPSPTARIGQKAALRGLAASLKQSAAVTGGVDKVDNQLAVARESEARGDLVTALTALRMALALAPDRHDLRQEYRRVDANLRVQLVDIHKEQANYEEENGMWAAASISWAKVADACPEDPLPARRAAAALFKAGGDLRKARDYVLRSRDLDPKSIDSLLLLARIYVGAGMEASARKELQTAAKLDPGHEMVKNLLKELGG